MRILALVTDAFGGFGGIAQSNRDLLEALARADSKNEIVAIPRIVSGVMTHLEKNVYQKKPIKNQLFYSLRSLWTLWREGSFDLIYCGHLFMAPLAAILSKITKTPFWLQIYGIESWNKPSFIIQLSVTKAVLITSISRHTRRKFLSWAKVDPASVRVLPNTVSEKFRPGEKSTELLKRYHLNGKKVLLTVGRLSSTEKYKGHDKVIEALPKLLAVYPNVIYVIAGDGDDRLRLETLTKKLQVDKSVLFLGQISEKDLLDLYRSADVFVMPGTGEGFGFVYLEAASCGIPVIGSSKDGSFDALLEGKLGRAVNPDNKDELYNAILDGLDSKIVGREKVERFSKSNFSCLVKDLIQKAGGNDTGVSYVSR